LRPRAESTCTRRGTRAREGATRVSDAAGPSECAIRVRTHRSFLDTRVYATWRPRGGCTLANLCAPVRLHLAWARLREREESFGLGRPAAATPRRWSFPAGHHPSLLPEHRICAYVRQARLPTSHTLTKMTTIGIKRSTALVNIPRHAQPPHSRDSRQSAACPITVRHVPYVHLSRSYHPKGNQGDKKQILTTSKLFGAK
jgi:hypothetical protein